MAEAKVKEVTLREKVVGMVGNILLEGLDLAEMPVTKEGFLFEVEGTQFVVKVIQKKNSVMQEDIKSLFTAFPEDTEPEEAPEAISEADEWANEE
jgi:hypothetical protein